MWSRWVEWWRGWLGRGIPKGSRFSGASRGVYATGSDRKDWEVGSALTGQDGRGLGDPEVGRRAGRVDGTGYVLPRPVADAVARGPHDRDTVRDGAVCLLVAVY